MDELIIVANAFLIMMQLFASDRKTLTALGGLLIAGAMFAFGYAMVPLYYRLCAALGIDTADSTVLQSIHNTNIAARPIRVEFDVNSHNDIVAMRSDLTTIRLATGTAHKITYTIENLTDQPVNGVAIPAYSPQRAASWVTKLHCFCFDELTLAPREVRHDPVVFIIGRELPTDIEVVSLAYTFFPTDTNANNLDNHSKH